MNTALLKNFELMKSSSLIDDPKNEKYFGKKENMVSVEKPFTSKPFLELLDDNYSQQRIWGSESETEIEMSRMEELDRTIFMGGFKKISRVPFWMKTYDQGSSYSLRTFEKESIEGERFHFNKERFADIPLSMDSKGREKNTRKHFNTRKYFLPDEFGLNSRKTYHDTFWDEEFKCFLWFYQKYD
jgi:hypothetical protein